MTDIGVFKQSLPAEDLSWDLTPDTDAAFDGGGTLDVSLFSQSEHYPDGFIKSGCILGKVTSSGLYGPYSGTTDEVQTVTEGGSGLTSFTLTLSGQTTASIAAAATAATVQADLEALSTVGVGNVLVTGSAGGPYTVKFRGALADTDVAQMTATPTGGTGTVTVATTTAGGASGSSDGRETAAGILKGSIQVVQPNGTLKTKVGCAFHKAFAAVSVAKLPYNAGNAPSGGFIDAGGKADLPLIAFDA